ncbi:MAG: carbohydrate binding family 9 domain-containing protein [Candidatus Marinimicrobia bacterium]|nr:carbohydrate binding family 9 domain-containing protein [Candidatus Neomarinimicrobiota bacterium]
MKYMRSLVALIWICIPGFILNAAQIKIAKQDRSISAYRIDESEIKIDGKLNEKIWQDLPRGADFLQRNPEDGGQPSQKTEFTVAYDAEYLYVAIRAYDDHPDLIDGILTRRDESTPSDWVYISIDSYHDHRTAFEFGLNAAGVKQDLRRFDDNNADFDWNAVWDGAVNVDAEGWSAEFAIPFRELRFNTAEELIWGFNVYRELPRNDNELAIWNYWSHEETGFVSNYGQLTGLTGVQAVQPLYVTPYLMGRSGMNDADFSNMDEYENAINLGVDIRKNFDLGLTFSGTINPDFGQIEADPAEFNLTEFESYFREQRPFFMEGGNILNFSMGFGDGDNSSNTLFYSRRIGRAPQGGVAYDGSAVSSVDASEFTKILAAGKVTGKLENGLSIGIMSALTAEEKAVVQYVDGHESTNVIEPATSYLLTRLQKDYRQGLTTLGGIFTATTRALDDTGMEWLREKAYTGGMDFNHRFGDRKYTIESAVAFSHVKGSEEAILNTQLHPARYFQRPDAPHLSVDSSATSLSGAGGKFIFGRSDRKINIFAGILATSPGLEVNDLGFMRAVDNINEFVWVGYRHWEAGDLFLNYSLNMNHWANWTFGGEFKGFGGNVNGNATLTNNWWVGGGLNFNSGGIVPFHLHGGPSIYGSKNVNGWFNIGSDSRRDLSGNISANYFYSWEDVHSFNLSPSLTFRPKKNVSLSLGPNFRFMDDSWAWITMMADTSNQTHYIFSGLELAQTSLTFRADVTLSTTLSLQAYAQAFIMGADYFDFVEVDDPQQHEYEKRFAPLAENSLSFGSAGALGGVDIDQDGIVDYVPISYVYSDFNYSQLTSNVVLRWEYSLGSVMYLVWSRGASAYEANSNYELAEDLGTLVGLDADNIFLIKINKLLNF